MGDGIKQTYTVHEIEAKEAMKYIHKHHYSHGSHNGPSPCYGLFEIRQSFGILSSKSLVGVLMFATPCSENVRASVFGPDYVDHITELHRLHIMDGTPPNTESFFIGKCLKRLKQDRPHIWAVLSFSDPTEGHKGIIYRATNAYFTGKTDVTTFYRDEAGRLRHPHQCGKNISLDESRELGWEPEMREGKYRYLWLLPDGKAHKKRLIRMCKFELKMHDWRTK